MSQNSESSCRKQQSILKIESLPFSEIPGQNNLFVDYQQNSPEVQKFYPGAVAAFADISSKAKTVLENYQIDRKILCDALEIDNKSYAAGEITFQNINLLRESDCLAVVTGQQAGLFSGAVYTIYKALSAIKAAECLRAQNIKAVPVFWIAEEDHDFDEVKETFVLDRQGKLEKIENTPENYRQNLPVGVVELDKTIEETISQLSGILPQTEFSGELETLLREAYRAGETYSIAFARILSKIFARYGLIIFSPLNLIFKKLAAPIFAEAVKKSTEIRERLLVRNEELKIKNYQAQVLVEEDFFPFFQIAENGERQSLKFVTQNSKLKSRSGREFSLDDLVKIAENSPENLSPNALMRPVVQDYLLPTICYFGGGAEIAYFAQNSVIYELLNRPAAAIFHRQSFTFIEAKHRRTLEKYDLKLPELFGGFEKILPPIVEKYLNPETAKKFIETEKIIDEQLDNLKRDLEKIEPTLAVNLTNRQKKIQYHLNALQSKFHHAQIRRDETVKRQIETLFASLYPHDALQERALNIVSFLDRYGFYFIDWIYDAIDLDDKAHRIIYL